MYNPTYVHGKVEHMEIAPKRLCSYCMYVPSFGNGGRRLISLAFACVRVRREERAVCFSPSQ